jgi:CheY-like chemotaxis protein
MRAAEPKERRIPALALTAFARPDDRKHAILAGYQAHLAKPFDMAELAIVVAGLVGRT